MRDQTEWVETVELGWNQVVGTDADMIMQAYGRIDSIERSVDKNPYGDGCSAQKIINILKSKY